MKRRWLVRVLVFFGVVAVLTPVALAYLFFYAVALSEGEVPPRSALPDLPEVLSVVTEQEGCGSRNCYRRLQIAGPPGMTNDEVADLLGRDETCRANSWYDRRPLCTGVSRQGENVWIYVTLSGLFK